MGARRCAPAAGGRSARALKTAANACREMRRSLWPSIVLTPSRLQLPSPTVAEYEARRHGARTAHAFDPQALPAVARIWFGWRRSGDGLGATRRTILLNRGLVSAVRAERADEH